MAIGRIVIDFTLLPEDSLSELLQRVADVAIPLLDPPHAESEPCARVVTVGGTQFDDEDFDIEFFDDDGVLEMLDVLPATFGEEFNPN